MVLGGLAVASAAAGAFVAARRSTQKPPQPEVGATRAEPRVSQPMTFEDSPSTAPIVQALAHVVPKGCARVAVWPRKSPKWFCVLVDGAARYYDLDRDMTAEQFAGLADCGFQPLPSTMSRTTSIYRTVAKRAALGFNEDRGDRVLVLLCPQAEWPKLSLRWPPMPASAK